MNVIRRGMGASVLGVRLMIPAVVLLAAGWVALSATTRLHRAEAIAGGQFLPSAPMAVSAPPFTPQTITPARARGLFTGLPLTFEANQSQAHLAPTDARARFLARGSGYSLFLGSQGAILSLVSQDQAPRHSPASGIPSRSSARHLETLQMKLVGANSGTVLSGDDRLPGVTNYFLGNDPQRWRQAVPNFARVRYQDVYPGINLVFYGNQGHLEYDFQIAPGADPSQPELEFDGARKLELVDGDLVIHAGRGTIRLAAPVIYQQIDARRQKVRGGFVLRSHNRAAFSIGPYDHSRQLVIDPILNFSTYFGGSGDEAATSVAVDAGGNIYLAGSTTSTNLPTAVGVDQQAIDGSEDVYVAKIAPPLGSTGASLVYVTYLGGSGTEVPVGVAADAAGNAYVAGTTTSTDFPTTLTAYQTTPEPGSSGTQHVFVTEVNNSVTAQALVYSSYLSGSGDDIASGMAIDSKGYVYITGTTTSTNPQDYSTTVQFPVSNIPEALPYQQIPRTALQFFVTKVYTKSIKIGSIAYSTYFGGGSFGTTNPIAVGGGIAVDPNGNIYFTGTTNFTYTGTSSTTDFPILNAYQPCLDQPPPTVIVNPAVCSNTSSTLNSDAFVAKLNPNVSPGLQLQWSTYLGGSQTDSGTGIGLDSGAANVYVTGTTNSPDVTLSATVTNAGTYQRCLDSPNVALGVTCPTITAPGPTDAFVGRLTNPSLTNPPTNMQLTYFSYLGGAGNEQGLALTVDAANGAVVTGWTQSTDFPIFPTPQDGIQSNLNGPQDAFVARLFTGATTGQTTTGSWATYFGGSAIDEGTGIAIDPNGLIYFAGDTNSSNLLTEKPLPANEGGNYNGGTDSFVGELGPVASLSLTGVLSLGTGQSFISAGNQATFTYTLTNNGPDLATNITVTDDIRDSTTVIPVSFVSATASSGTCNSSGGTGTSVSCTIPSLQSGSTAIITIVLVPQPTADGSEASFNGGNVSATASNNITPAEVSVPAEMSDFRLGLSPTNVSVPQAGDTAVYQVQLTPVPVYGSNISLSVTGLPAGAGAAFTTNPVTLQGSSPGTSTLSITTQTRPITTSMSRFTRQFYALWLPIPGLMVLGFVVSDRRRRHRLAGCLMLYLLFALLVLQPACSGTSTQPPATGTPAGSFTLTLTASSGSDSKSTSFVLTVP
ncbi:MAG TPA: SBBP repeat-containing protein [Verrucomicrobiae bacterium]|nr:SBBP repeat-containing protein [Verrucomicrobiae bacterium]